MLTQRRVGGLWWGEEVDLSFNALPCIHPLNVYHLGARHEGQNRAPDTSVMLLGHKEMDPLPCGAGQVPATQVSEEDPGRWTRPCLAPA